MMTKKIVLGLGLCSLLAFPVANAQAEVGGFCTGGVVVAAGAFSGGKAVQIRNTRTDCGTWANGTARNFQLDDSGGQANAMLAAALAAQSAQLPVVIVSQNVNYAEGSKLTLLYAQGL